MLSKKRALPWYFLLVHGFILVNFLVEIAYSSYMIFVVLKPKGVSGPLYSAALQIPHQLMVTRRLYATEFWIAFAGFAIYFGVTELVPRILRFHWETKNNQS